MYIDDASKFTVSNYMNKKYPIVPNLTYYPRGTFLPKNTVADGSVAILRPKDKINPRKKDIKFFASKDFEKYYRIARNFGTRSLNVDSNSVYFYGVIKE